MEPLTLLRQKFRLLQALYQGDPYPFQALSEQEWAVALYFWGMLDAESGIAFMFSLRSDALIAKLLTLIPEDEAYSILGDPLCPLDRKVRIIRHMSEPEQEKCLKWFASHGAVFYAAISEALSTQMDYRNGVVLSRVNLDEQQIKKLMTQLKSQLFDPNGTLEQVKEALNQLLLLKHTDWSQIEGFYPEIFNYFQKLKHISGQQEFAMFLKSCAILENNPDKSIYLVKLKNEIIDKLYKALCLMGQVESVLMIINQISSSTLEDVLCLVKIGIKSKNKEKRNQNMRLLKYIEVNYNKDKEVF